MCLSPIILKKKAKRLTYSQGVTDSRPCGRCALCLKRYANSWAFRLQEEAKVSSSAIFLTLTYDDDNLPTKNVETEFINYDTGEITARIYKDVPTLRKSHYQSFMKALRKEVPHVPYIKKNGTTGYKSNIKYYACGEYGSSTLRPHYHAIIFNLPRNFTTDPEIISKIWNKGIIHIGTCNIKSIRYTTKYIMKNIKNKQTTLTPEFALQSKNLGKDFLTPQMKFYLQNHQSNLVTIKGGQKTVLPRYYKDRLYTKMQMHHIKLNAIDENSKLLEQLFNNNHKLVDEWKKQTIRKFEKANKTERTKL